MKLLPLMCGVGVALNLGSFIIALVTGNGIWPNLNALCWSVTALASSLGRQENADAQG